MDCNSACLPTEMQIMLIWKFLPNKYHILWFSDAACWQTQCHSGRFHYISRLKNLNLNQSRTSLFVSWHLLSCIFYLSLYIRLQWVTEILTSKYRIPQLSLVFSNQSCNLDIWNPNLSESNACLDRFGYKPFFIKISRLVEKKSQDLR